MVWFASLWLRFCLCTKPPVMSVYVYVRPMFTLNVDWYQKRIFINEFAYFVQNNWNVASKRDWNREMKAERQKKLPQHLCTINFLFTGFETFFWLFCNLDQMIRVNNNVEPFKIYKMCLIENVMCAPKTHESIAHRNQQYIFFIYWRDFSGNALQKKHTSLSWNMWVMLCFQLGLPLDVSSAYFISIFSSFLFVTKFVESIN